MSDIASSHLSLDNEPYMGTRQREYFREKLLTLKSELEETIKKVLIKLNTSTIPTEEVEKSSAGIEREMDLRAYARNRDMIQRINQALERIDDGSYGYCQETDEPIGFKRLDANPTAIFCITSQEVFERSGSHLVSDYD